MNLWNLFTNPNRKKNKKKRWNIPFGGSVLYVSTVQYGTPQFLLKVRYAVFVKRNDVRNSLTMLRTVLVLVQCNVTRL